MPQDLFATMVQPWCTNDPHVTFEAPRNHVATPDFTGFLLKKHSLPRWLDWLVGGGAVWLVRLVASGCVWLGWLVGWLARMVFQERRDK